MSVLSGDAWPGCSRENGGHSRSPVCISSEHSPATVRVWVQRYGWVTLLLPLLGWQLLFPLSKYIPVEMRPPVDVVSLLIADNYLMLGQGLPHQFMHLIANPLLTLCCAFVYTIHAILPFLFLAYLYAKDRSQILRFVFIFGCVNLAGVIIELLYPCAPPWYNEKFGTAAASYAMGGNPARLADVDALFGISFYKSMYGKGPIVFGSFPSLHAAWPYIIATSKLHPGRWTMYYSWFVWFSAVYLTHHFVVDILGAILLIHFFNWVADHIFAEDGSLEGKTVRGKSRPE